MPPLLARLRDVLRRAALRLRSGRAAALRFRAAVAGCTLILLAMLWGGATLHLLQDKAQTTRLAAMNVGNLSQVVDEHVTRLVFELDSKLLAARREYETRISGGGAATGVWTPAPPRLPTVRVEIVDADGYTAGGAGEPRRYVGDSDAFSAQRAARSDRLAIGKPVPAAGGSAEKPEWRIPLSRRLSRPDGSFAGVVMASVAPAFLAGVFDKAVIGQQGFIAVLGRDDLTVRACSRAAGIGVRCRDLAKSPLAGELAHRPAGAFLHASPADGTPLIVGYRALSAYPLVVAIGVSKAEVLAGYTERRTWLLVGCGLVSALVLAVAVLLVEQSAREQRARAALRQQSETLRAARREAERANAAAQAADRAKSEFLANMSHELRTPLNAILGFSEAMAGAMFGPLSERYRDYADSIHGAGKHLLEVLNDILDLSKVEAGRLELHEEPVAVGELFDACREIMAERARDAGLALSFTATDLALRADLLRLRQVMLNLLSNAVKFTPEGGAVAATAGLTAAGEVAIAVRDSGIGIRPQDIPLVLEPFGQVDNELTRSQQGTGLGLPLVRRLVELHGGRLDLTSSPGRGTTVTLTFPASRTVPLIEAAG